MTRRNGNGARALLVRINTAADLVSAAQADAAGADFANCLHALAALVGTAEAAERTAVALLRAEGASWAVVGEALGVTRSAAQQRFGS